MRLIRPKVAHAATPVPAGPVAPRGYWGRTFESLEDRDFRYLWAGMLAMMGGINISMVARSQLTWDLTGSPLAVGLVGAGFAPPILLLSLFGGVVADRIDRKRIIQVGQVGMAIMSLFVGLSIFSGTITVFHLIAASLIQGTLFAFLMPARQAIIPQIVGKERMVNAVALNSSGMSLMTLAAPGVGGVIYGKLGPDAAYFVISGLAMTAFVLTSFLPTVGKADSKPSAAVLSDMKEGFRYAGRNKTVLLLLLLVLSTTVLAMPFRNLLPVLVDEVFGRGPEAVGLMLSMIGLGALLGSLAFAGMRASHPRGIALIGATVISGASLIGVTLTPTYAVAVVIMLFVGLGDSGRRTLNAALLMEQSDDAHRGRVMGMYMMNFGLMPAGVIPIAAIAEAAGIQIAVGSAAALLVVIGLSFLFARRIRAL